MKEQERNNHEKFSELCALAMSGCLTDLEQAELRRHLQACNECREDYERYLLLTREGIPHLVQRYSRQEEPEGADLLSDNSALIASSGRVREKVLSRIGMAEPFSIKHSPQLFTIPLFVSVWRVLGNPVTGAIAACLLIVAGYGVYRFAHLSGAATRAEAHAERSLQALTSEKKILIDQLNAQTRKLAELEYDSSQKQEQIERLQAQMRAKLQAEEQLATELAANLKSANAAKAHSDEQLRAASHDHDVLAARLHELQTAYQNAQAELVSLRAERDRATLRLASLESEGAAALARGRDQERRLHDDEQYLASDRDIRELMGARQLYMADVFDVSSDSRTRKPYGRIFYTKSKSLIFYAFDLDRQPGIKNAAFQAWGRNESSQAGPINLGILYLDNEQNRRWALRFDDPQKLTEIDAVFVTVEPYGGSGKPTGKPFLYASLRREPNHP